MPFSRITVLGLSAVLMATDQQVQSFTAPSFQRAPQHAFGAAPSSSATVAKPAFVTGQTKRVIATVEKARLTPSSSSTPSSLFSTAAPQVESTEADTDEAQVNIPPIGPNGVYSISNGEEHKALLMPQRAGCNQFFWLQLVTVGYKNNVV
uniref:Uncharacterized protein n=1 Tax=Craspedostauros australis TaxID=1486917 RepID=A0A7R9WY93_9STRA|mmetsp:Transcript_4254/g.11124  ORF Transcript_4254/g.11124 Transcript_4254/m.11124 type:complete len:150 (+) Transcript_4254:396-845(+)